MENLLQDLRYAFRLLLQSPSFSAIAILTLALGSGANTAIFSVVNAVLLRPLTFRDPSHLVIVAEKSSYPVISTSYQNYIDWRDQTRSFESLEGTRSTTITLTGAGEPERLNARMITAPLLPLLGVDARIGRTFRADEDRPGGTPVVLLSYGLWQRRFAGAADVLGKSINLDSRPYSIVGVLPSGFELLQPSSDASSQK
jgi:putative ABC transport system permease protein